MKILVVDDEVVSKKKIEKILSTIGECTALDDGEKAILLYDEAVQNKEPFDLICLDISMPGIDGKQLLDRIRRREKNNNIPRVDQAKVLMVTSRMNKSIVKTCIKLGCNGYITKPINKSQLYSALENMGLNITGDSQGDSPADDVNYYKNLVKKILQRYYKGKIKLPVLPRIVNEVQNLLDGADPTIDELVKTIENDAVMSSKLISVSNSIMYKGLDSIDDLHAALIRLGMGETKSIITAIANKNLFDSKNKFVKKILEKGWIHSFACACCAKLIAKELELANDDAIFLMGIMHDIGIVMLVKAISDIFPEDTFDDPGLNVAIQEIHTTFSAELIKKWNFSEKYIKVAELHHWKNYPPTADKELIIINLANNLANKLGFYFLNPEYFLDNNSEPEEPGHDVIILLKQLNIDYNRFIEIGEEAKVIINDSAKVF